MPETTQKSPELEEILRAIREENDKHTCTKTHVSEKAWIALGSIVAALALLASFMGWLMSGAKTSAGNSIRLDNLEQKQTLFSTRLDGFDQKLDKLGISLARVEQELLDSKKYIVLDPRVPNDATSLKKPALKNGAVAKK